MKMKFAPVLAAVALAASALAPVPAAAKVEVCPFYCVAPQQHDNDSTAAKETPVALAPRATDPVSLKCLGSNRCERSDDTPSAEVVNQLAAAKAVGNACEGLFDPCRSRSEEVNRV